MIRKRPLRQHFGPPRRKRQAWRSAAVLLGVGLLLFDKAYSTEPAASNSPIDVTFVRGGVLSRKPVRIGELSEGNKAPDFSQPSDRRYEFTAQLGLIDYRWTPGNRYEITSGAAFNTLRAPQSCSPYALWKFPLENVRDAAAGGASPDCVVQFSPEGVLAIGSFEGWLRIVNCRNGATFWSKRLAEGMIKRIAWSADGQTLYAGEQSPDGRLLAFDLGDRTETGAPSLAWSVRLADQLESSRPPAHDRFGIYTLPAVYDLQTTPDGRVLVAGTHRWTIDGKNQSRSLLACYSREGKLVWQFPNEKPSNQSWGLTFFACDPQGKRVVCLATPGEDATPPAKNGAAIFLQLDGQTGAIVGQAEIQPLKPYFDRVESWDSVSISAAGDRGVVGLNDGRALLFEFGTAGPKLLRELDLATPMLVGDIPIVAAASYARFHGNQLCLQTQNTHIPFGNSQAANRPPIAHRGANTLTVCDADGNPQWLYRGPFSLSGSWADRPKSGNPRWLIVACREEPGAAESGNFGLLAFDLQAKGSGIERLVYYYPTEGPAMFTADISPNGRYIAVAETPTPTPDGRDLYGTYQVHVLH